MAMQKQKEAEEAAKKAHEAKMKQGIVSPAEEAVSEILDTIIAKEFGPSQQQTKESQPTEPTQANDKAAKLDRNMYWIVRERKEPKIDRSKKPAASGKSPRSKKLSPSPSMKDKRRYTSEKGYGT